MATGKPRKIRIESEEQAWALIEQALAGHTDGILPRIAVANWAKFDAKFWVSDAEGMITPPIMKGLLDVQNAIFRVRTALVKSHGDLRTLSEGDRRDYEIKVRVKKGSTHVSFDLNAIAGQLGHDIVGKMSPDQIFYSVLALILGCGLNCTST